MATNMVTAWSDVYIITTDTRKRNDHLDFGLIYVQVNKVLLRLNLLFSLKMFCLGTCQKLAVGEGGVGILNLGSEIR